MRVSVLPTVALALSGVAHGLDFSTSGDADASVWDSVPAKDVDSRQVSSNKPTKRQSGWNPPSSLVSPLRQVWDHCVATYSNGLYGFRNYGWDQLMAPSASGYSSSLAIGLL